MAFMIGFCVFAPLGDGLAKVLSGSIPILQIVLARYLAQAALFGPLSVLLHDSLLPPRHLWPTLIARAVLHVAGLTAMFTSLIYLPLADAIAIAYVMPFIVLLLGALWLGEEVGQRRIIACLIGFLGTLLVVQPAFDAVGLIALLPVGVAIIFALFMLITRQLSREIGPIALQTISAPIALALVLPALWVGTVFELPWLSVAPVSSGEAWLLAVLGILGALAHLALTWALKLAAAATLAPIQYLEIPAAALVGWWFFAEFPNGLALTGIAVTLISGVYVVASEPRKTSSAS
ncbi:MAG: DMT family transporter [Pseudomonadota bacterium]